MGENNVLAFNKANDASSSCRWEESVAFAAASACAVAIVCAWKAASAPPASASMPGLEANFTYGPNTNVHMYT